MHKALQLLLMLGCWVTAAPLVLAQQSVKRVPTAAELRKNIAAVGSSIVGESDASTSLLGATAKQLVTYLKTHEVSAAAAEYLGLGYTASRETTYLKVFTFSYSSGGTRGVINCPVLQWKNAAGQLFAYAADEESGFGKIYRLTCPGRTLYLLLGSEQGSSICLRDIARLVELKGNYLVLDSPAFNGKPALDLCNVRMTFEARRQVLRLIPDDTFGPIPDATFGPIEVYGTKPVVPTSLRFDNGKFVRVSQSATVLRPTRRVGGQR